MSKPNLKGLRVAVLAADGVEQVELTSPREKLEDHGAEVEVISLRSGSIRAMNLLKPGKKIRVAHTVFTADPDRYDALLLPGGFASPDFLRQSEQVLDFVRRFDRHGKPIAVICHGPWVLVSAGLVRGRRLTSWPGLQDDVRNAGGTREDEAVVRDGNWVSSRGPQDVRKFNRAMLELFADEAPFTDLHEGGSAMSLGGLVASGLALAAIGYGLRQWQGGEPGDAGHRYERGDDVRGTRAAPSRYAEANVAL
ncbi:MAG TPA: type 1 glutamine amidotransferase domain-containing protein [Longimicrobiaceae bacterium]|nr:type 1 glutamine amidotransferase domain-containing protein [Longimicrobiaceae bacterium]